MCWAALSSAILDVSNLEVHLHPANALLDFCQKSDIVLFNRPPPPPQSSLTAFSQLFFDAKVDIKSMSERSEHFPCWSNFFPLWLKLRTHPKKSHENWIYIENIYSDKYENWWSPIPQPEPHLGTMSPFYRTQVNLGSDLWVRLSVSEWVMFLKLNWCYSGWWGYQLNANW